MSVVLQEIPAQPDHKDQQVRRALRVRLDLRVQLEAQVLQVVVVWGQPVVPDQQAGTVQRDQQVLRVLKAMPVLPERQDPLVLQEQMVPVVLQEPPEQRV